MTSGHELDAQGWVSSTLGAAAHLVKDKIDPIAASDDMPYVGLEHVEAHSMKLLGQGRASDVKSTKTRFSAGDVLYGKLRPYLNKVARPNFDGICSTDFLVFAESPELDRGYLAYFLNQLWVANRAHELSNGVELPRVDWKSLGSFPIAYPEDKRIQRDIVNQIKRAKTLGTSAGSHISGARRAIERFRQAVLAAACSGRLTSEWRTSHDTTASLDALIRQVSLSGKRRFLEPATGWTFDIPESWSLVSLDSLTTIITSGSRGWAKYYSTDGPLFIRSQDIHSDRLDLADAAHVRPPKGSEGERTKVRRGDVLVTITGANVTRAAFVDHDIRDAYVNQHIALARPALPELAEYLHLWIVSRQHGRKKLSADSYGAGRPGLNLENIRSLPVGLPSMDEQAEIVRRAEELLTLAAGFEARIEAASRRVDRSSQATLTKAFRGELMPAESGSA